MGFSKLCMVAIGVMDSMRSLPGEIWDEEGGMESVSNSIL